MRQLIIAVDMVPLAVTLIANQAQYMSCRDLLDQWNDQKTKMVSRGYEGRLSSLDVSIQVSLRSTRFRQEPAARRLLQLLSVLPDGASDVLLAAMTEEGFLVHLASATLLRTSLAFRDPSGRIQTLTPVREHVSSYLPISARDLAIAFHHVKCIGEQYMDIHGTHQGQQLVRQYAPLYDNLISVVQACLLRPLEIEPVHSTRVAWIFCTIMQPEARRRESLNGVIIDAIRVAEENGLEIQKAMLFVHSSLGFQGLATLEAFDANIQVLRDAGNFDSVLIGLERKARMFYLELDQLDQGYKTLEEALSLLGHVSVSKPTVPFILVASAELLLLHDPVKASRILYEALAVNAADASLYDQQLSPTYRALSLLNRRRGHYSKSRVHLQAALDSDLQTSIPLGASLGSLSRLLLVEGRFGEAEKASVLSCEIFRQLDRIDDRGASVQINLLTLYISQERLSEAETLLQQILQVIRLGPLEPLLVSLLVELARDDPDRAQDITAKIAETKTRTRRNDFRVLTGESYMRRGAFRDALAEFSVLLITACKPATDLGFQ